MSMEAQVNAILQNGSEKSRTGRVGEEHDQAVDTDTPSTRRREPVLERIDERLVDILRLVVALLLLPHLLLEPQPLLERIVQLGVGVAELLPAHEALEPLAEPRS